jgi:hypothetical protein
MDLAVRKHIIAILFTATMHLHAQTQDSPIYKALRCPPPDTASTWAVLDRDGLNKKVDPYLSSLADGETGTGIITSPPFKLTVKSITFTICGHDGQSNDQGKNHIALVDARKGNVLIKTSPPGNDAMQPRTWDVINFRNIEARIEVRDDNAATGFAWMGIGQIDAGPDLNVDFSKGLPQAWDRPKKQIDVHSENLIGPIPFQRHAGLYSLITRAGAVDIPCGFNAEKLFILGGTVNAGKPGEIYGAIEVHYRDVSPDVFPLMVGFTLDSRYKRLSPSQTMHLASSADPFQYFFVIQPKDAPIEKIRLTASSDKGQIPRITAITCLTDAQSDNLTPLPAAAPSVQEAAWISAHSLSANSPDLDEIRRQLQKSD